MENKVNTTSAEDETVYKALMYTDHAECTNIGRYYPVTSDEYH